MSPGAQAILSRVLEAMQHAEELGGPEGEDYVAMMRAIASEATRRADTAAGLDRRTLTFEFPNRAGAERFFRVCEDQGRHARISHRVVEVVDMNVTEVSVARSVARQHGGTEHQ